MRRVVSKLLAKPWWLVVVLVAVMGVAFLGRGLVATATHDFSDVSTGAWYHGDVTWIKDRAITLGCGTGIYCPNNYVTRAEMAAFLKREGDVLTPTFLDAWNIGFLAAGPLDLDANPVRCGTGSITPTYEQQAVLMGRGSVAAAAAAPTVSFWLYGVYSTDGGSTWIRTTPRWSAEVRATAAGQEIALPYTGHVDLTPGTTYEFGLEFQGVSGTTGDATSDAESHWCALTAEILNRNP